MENRIRFKGGQKPPKTGFATPHVAGMPEHQPDREVNDSLGSAHPSDTMVTGPGDAPKAGGKETGKKAAG